MFEVRLAQKGEIVYQKEIWKLCFGDQDSYIDFYYANRYKEHETLLLLYNGDISAMLTMIPVKLVTPDNQIFHAAMLYAIATHPQKQNRGFATHLMNYSDEYLKANNKNLSVLVPAEEQLFSYYYKRGYEKGFYIRETSLNRHKIDTLPISQTHKGTISPIVAEEYNLRRNKQLSDRFYIAYEDEDINYQKKLSRQSGADIYGIDFEKIQGCAAIERLSLEKVLIKEILLPEELLNEGIKLIVQQLDAKEYIVRTPAYLGGHLGGSIRPFAMAKVHRKINLELTPENLGYLGFAFD
ncbi:hypothetical protein Dred_2229 [Desulforamulus reducens MI-1]|uniref:N-acetyltransferase domain-containing protein n=1 Tax=Desulforamulus reducens (strain ATCC BAA-1160 / DSM 100696 / MI-1) TaxID=349161 RepID=A4J6N9_DESRM|nr:GNAT family N-acetyltransferase [Desulforamulus reducens]ABO50742.1 hypothetical protein Dred_2229 [Desulforamulus reducens MI-1]